MPSNIEREVGDSAEELSGRKPEIILLISFKLPSLLIIFQICC